MRRITWAAAMALGLVSMPALAEDEQGFYAGIGAGELSVDFNGNIDGTNISFDDGDTAYRVFGGWQFNDYLAIEAGYVDGGTASDTVNVGGIDIDVGIDTTGFDLLLRGIVPIGSSFHAFAEAGMISWDADFKASAFGTTLTDSDSGEDLAYGAGFGFDLGRNAQVRAEYSYYDISDADVDSIMASFLWKFR